VRDFVVNVGDVRGAEPVRWQTSSLGDDCAGRACIVGVWRRPKVLSEKDAGESVPFAFGFGWASSFCSRSNSSAARAVRNDLRLRAPVRSRQSA